MDSFQILHPIRCTVLHMHFAFLTMGHKKFLAFNCALCSHCIQLHHPLIFLSPFHYSPVSSMINLTNFWVGVPPSTCSGLTSPDVSSIPLLCHRLNGEISSSTALDWWECWKCFPIMFLRIIMFISPCHLNMKNSDPCHTWLICICRNLCNASWETCFFYSCLIASWAIISHIICLWWSVDCWDIYN